jgi:hypothetical protein
MLAQQSVPDALECARCDAADVIAVGGRLAKAFA